MGTGEHTEKIGDYTVREQSFEEIHRTVELPFTLCGVNPYGFFRHIRRFVAEREGQIVGDGWTMASRHNPWGELGHYGIISEAHKRKGLGGRLLARCVEAVREAGMKAMFVDTGPSIAHGVYEKYGFRDVVPGHPEWMARSFDGRTIQDYLADYYDVGDPPREVRPLDFGHLIEIRALLNASVDPAFLVKNYLLTLFADDQLHMGQILVELPALGAPDNPKRRVCMLGLFSGPKLVGFSTLAPWRTTRWDNGHEAHIGQADFYLRPSLWRGRDFAVLFEEVRSRALEMGFGRLRAMETPRQTAKTDALLELGFRVKFEMPKEVTMGEGTPDRGVYPAHRMEDLAVYEIAFGEPEGFTHPYRVPWDY